MSYKGTPPKPSSLHMTRLPSLPPKQFGTMPKVSAAPSKSTLTPASDAPFAYVAPPPSLAAVPSPSRKRNNTALASLPSSLTPRSPRGRGVTRTKTTSVRFDTRQLRNDRLGTLVSELTSAFSNAESWEALATSFRGCSCLSDKIDDLDHPAKDLLRRWREEGIPVLSSSAPWTAEQKDAAVARGCHPSASEHSDFIREEMAEFIDNKFWAVLPYELVKHLDLMFSPAAVKDE